MAKEWMLYDPNKAPSFYDTEQEALVAGEARVEGFLGDGQWNEDVYDVVVARVTAVVTREVLGRRAEMDDDAWQRLTGGSDCDEWWDFRLVPLELNL